MNLMTLKLREWKNKMQQTGSISQRMKILRVMSVVSTTLALAANVA